MTSAALHPGPPASTDQACILVVDDSPNQLIAIEALLASLGQRVVTASSGQEGLRLLLELDCAVVLLDVHLPDIDGFEVARLMRERERTCRTPIIFLSGLSADSYFSARGYALGAVDFLFKPFDPMVLRAKVEVFVELYLHRERLKLQAEREKAESERTRLLNLLVQTPAAIAITRGPDFVFEFANPLYEKVVGRPVVLGRPLREVLPELHSQHGVMEALRRAMRTGEPFMGRELPVLLERHGTREEAFFDLVYQPLRDERGEVEWMLTHAVEVTEQVRARRRLEATEAALRQREAEFRSLAENIPDLVARFDREHRLHYVNRVIERNTGLPASDFPGRTSAELGMSPRKVAPWDAAVTEALQGRDASVEFDFPTPGGRRFFQAHVVPERDEHGEVRTVLAVARDMTEARQREQALRESEGHLRLLAEAGELLSSLEDRAVFQRLTELVVPRLADWAAVDLVTDAGTVERVAAVHGEPEKTALAFELARRWPIDKDSHGGIGQVLRSAEPLLLEDMPDALQARMARSEEHLALARTLGFKSSLCLPLMGRGRVLGALTLVQAESGRRFGQKDLPLARELARRAGLAVDNALLYREAREAQGRASRLQAVAAALSRAATPEAVAHAILTEGLVQSGTDAGVVYLREPDGGLRLLHSVGYPPDIIQRVRHFAAGEQVPQVEVARTGEALWFSSTEEVLARYPDLTGRVWGYEGRAALPLWSEGQGLGCLWLSFQAARHWPPEERSFLTALTQLCSQALERARLSAGGGAAAP